MSYTKEWCEEKKSLHMCNSHEFELNKLCKNYARLETPPLAEWCDDYHVQIPELPKKNGLTVAFKSGNYDVGLFGQPVEKKITQEECKTMRLNDQVCRDIGGQCQDPEIDQDTGLVVPGRCSILVDGCNDPQMCEDSMVYREACPFYCKVMLPAQLTVPSSAINMGAAPGAPATLNYLGQPGELQCAKDVGCFDQTYPCEQCCNTGKDVNGFSCWDQVYTRERCCNN